MGLSFYGLSLDCCRFCLRRDTSLSCTAFVVFAVFALCVCVSLVNLLAGELACNALSFCLPRT